MNKIESQPSPFFFYLTTFIISICGIVYELLIATASSYLEGDSVWQFSLTIGLYMSALGLGAFISKFIGDHLLDWFVASEILLGLLGGLSVLSLFWVFSVGGFFLPWMITLTLGIGFLVGLEIPLLMRILEDRLALRQNAAHVLSYDYLGGLLGSLAFPLFFLPQLGLLKTACLIGGFNLLVAIALLRKAWGLLLWPRAIALASVACLSTLMSLFYYSEDASAYLEQRLYRDPIIHSQQTSYQHITMTQRADDLRLYINGNLQFSSRDEYRYHEALVHIPFSFLDQPRRVLILGGGDGLAVREVLTYPTMVSVDLVDLDPGMTALSSSHEVISDLNEGSLKDPRVHIHNDDAFRYVFRSTTSGYDAIIIDLPDPEAPGLSKLYSREFYAALRGKLSDRGVLVTQATSPYFTPHAFWCIGDTLTAAGWRTYPYQVEVPTFGNWGFHLATRGSLDPPNLRLRAETRFLSDAIARASFHFPKDVHIQDGVKLEINSIMKPALLAYYRRDWQAIVQ